MTVLALAALMSWRTALPARAESAPPAPLATPTQNPRPTPPAFPFSVKRATPIPALDALLQRTAGWTGGDGAHSFALSPRLSLWLFGDTFYGEVRDQRRVAPRMVHNSAAWLRDGAFAFFPTQADLLCPKDAPLEWYWPGEGAITERGLELFCMRVRSVKGGAFGFDFDWYASDLLEIENPREAPTRWRVVSQTPGPSQGGVQLGAAVAVEGAWLYAWGLRPDDPSRSLCVARRKRDGGAWTWFCAGAWRQTGTPQPLFTEAAPEMSVSPFRGGWLAVYSPRGLSPEIALRWAPYPEGPWSDVVTAYRAPEASRGLLTYGARAHPELDGPGLVLTYNCNAPTPERLRDEASAYAPRFVRLSL